MGNHSNIVAALLNVTTSSTESAVVLSGVKGLGKSTVLERVSEQLGNRPHCLLRSNRGESAWPLSGLMKMLASVQLSTPVNIAQHIPTGHTTAVDRYALAREIHEKFLSHLSAGTVILIDDADTLDEDSQAIIGYLGARLNGTGVTLIVSVTDPLENTAWSAIKRLDLGPLDAEESRKLGIRIAGAQTNNAVINIVLGLAEGRPGTINYQLTQMTSKQLGGTAPLSLPLKPGDDAQEFVKQELNLLNDTQKRIMSLGAMAPMVEPGAITGLSPDDQDALEDLLAEGWMRGNGRYLEVSLPLIRAALFWQGTAAQRRERHEHLAANTVTEAFATYHRSFLDTANASSCDLVAAASELLNLGHINYGLETLERVMYTWELGEECLVHLTASIGKLMDALELEQAWRFLRMAWEHAEKPATILELSLIGLKLDLLLSGATQRADAEGMARKYRSVEPAHCARLLCFAAVSHGFDGDLHAARSCLRLAEEILPNFGESPDELHVQAHLVVASLEQRIDPIVAAYRSQSASEDPFTMLSLGFALSHVGRHEESGRVFATLIAGRRDISPLARSMAQLLNANNELRANTFSGAYTAIDAWLKSLKPDILAPLPHILQAWYWLSKDKPERAMPFIESAHPVVAARPHSQHAVLLAATEGEYALMRGNLDTAIAHFRRAQLSVEGSADGNYVRMATNLIEALVLSEKFEDAANEYRTAQSFMATASGRRNRLVARRGHAMARQGATSLNLFQTLIDEWTSGDSRFEYARLLHAYASRLAYLGHADEARTQFMAARSLFVGMGAKGWAQRIDACLANRGPAVRQGAMSLALSRDESRIVVLLQQGRTNKEISTELFIAVSTVEVRLSKLYKKTGAANRHHLASLFAV